MKLEDKSTDEFGLWLKWQDDLYEEALIVKEYGEFLVSKETVSKPSGFECSEFNLALFDFQRDIVRWALRQGRAAVFADCGLGKTFMQLEWAHRVNLKTGGQVLILAPLAVSTQTVNEGKKLGVEAVYRREQTDEPIIVTNYEMLEHFDPARFSGIVLDESSILKSFEGKFRNEIIESFGRTEYRLACTATPAPNDHMELGNHSEFLGNLTRTEMLSTFFVHDGGDTAKWRLKGHAQADFWRWVASWAVMLRNPADLGYDGSAFELPPINYIHSVVEGSKDLCLPEHLFALPAQTLDERRSARAGSTNERVAEVARIIKESFLCEKSQTTSGESTWKTSAEKSWKTPLMPQNIEPTTEGLALPIIGRTPRGNTDSLSVRGVMPPCETDTQPNRSTETDFTKQESSGHMASPRKDTESYLNLNAVHAQYAEALPPIKWADCVLTTATPRGECEDSYALNATLDSGALEITPQTSSGPQNTCARSLSAKWIVWVNLNIEQDAVAAMLGGDCISVYGSLSREEKESRLHAWMNGDVPVLISKPSILGWGVNLQLCHNVVFLGLNDSFEQFYQAVRRCWRFGQKRTVNCYIVTSDLEGAVVENINRKAAQADEMAQAMVEHMHVINEQNIRKQTRTQEVYRVREEIGDGFRATLGDSCEQLKSIKSDSIHYSIFSPPFASLYTYSASDRDLGNCKTHADFFEHFKFMIPELYRVIMPGRLLSFHCMNLPTSKERDGVIGITDFRGQLIKLFTDAGFIFHSEVCIWKDPVTAMQRTKALGLLHKQIKKDSCMSRQGIPDYLVTMRKPGDNPERVTHTNESFPVSMWQRYASPVWMDIHPSDTLQRESAREEQDERHICPLQLQVIERGIELWTNPGDTVLSPFMGIGSEGYVALQKERKFVGIELKQSYFDQAVQNLRNAKPQESLFASFSETA